MAALHPSAVGVEPIAQFSTHLASTAAAASLEVAVPTCGDWTMADLIWHMTEVQRFWSRAIANRPAGPENYDVPTRPSDDALVSTLQRTSAELLDALRGVDATEHAWSWAEEQTVGFTLRRQTHEALIHLVDALLAAGEPLPTVDPLLAADGIDEVFGVMVSPPAGSAVSDDGPAVAIHATDTGDQWLVAFATVPEIGAVMTPTDRPSDATLTGSAFALDLWLWGRSTDDSTISVDGDESLAHRLRELVAGETQ